MRTKLVDGLLTLFYDGSKELYNQDLHFEFTVVWDQLKNTKLTAKEKFNHLSFECKEYINERLSWEQVIVEEGVTVIPHTTFGGCHGLKKVIFANTVTKIKDHAFYCCKQLVHVNLGLGLVCVEMNAFGCCNLSCVFVPPSCREIRSSAFASNKNLSILQVPQETELDNDCIDDTKLAEFALSETNTQTYPITWIKNINADDTYALHRACSSYEPLKEVIYGIIEEKGLKAFNEKNEIGITPSRYLKENPYADLSEMEIVRDYFSKKFNF
ncbi:hypothetical protein CTEN210_12882 [Chaetoceros tenuissimus]|uniref:Uncharacterized protein n=1 Tax=Chaetoceros tenuissimus TaxID=426638 RepID=A0AAD3D455_9STRA|nr:hypothetical protein CTEN210_12882 [Chaetoceros tenuissimus]